MGDSGDLRWILHYRDENAHLKRENENLKFALYCIGVIGVFWLSIAAGWVK